VAFAILRTQKLKSPVAVRRSMAHAFRSQATPNADPGRLGSNDHFGAQSPEDALAAFNGRLPEKHRKDAVLAIEYLITASPEGMANKSRSEQDRYFADSLAWLKDRHGAENVVYAGIHRDETTPHMYAYVVPRDPDTGRLNAKRWLGGVKALSTMQSEFVDQVGHRHGLVRGIERSRAKHTTVKAFYGALEKGGGQHVSIPQAAVEPRVLKKRMFSRDVEDSAAVAARVTKGVQKFYDPSVKAASTAALDRRRADEMSRTAIQKDRELKRVQGRLNEFERVFEDGLSNEQRRALAMQAKAMRTENRIEQERQRRVDALPDLFRRAAGAAHTFAIRALAAIRNAADRWRDVDWGKVEREAIHEATTEHRQTRRSALEAVLKHSPAQADKTPDQVKTILDQVHEPEQAPQPERRRSAAPRMR